MHFRGTRTGGVEPRFSSGEKLKPAFGNKKTERATPNERQQNKNFYQEFTRRMGFNLPRHPAAAKSGKKNAGHAVEAASASLRSVPRVFFPRLAVAYPKNGFTPAEFEPQYNKKKPKIKPQHNGFLKLEFFLPQKLIFFFKFFFVHDIHIAPGGIPSSTTK